MFGKFRTPKIVIYSHDTMGLGHVRRNLLIATTLAKSEIKANVLLISGTHQLSEFDLPEGVDCLTLPGIAKSEIGSYTPRQFNLGLKSVINLRSRIIQSAVKAFEPDIFIADNVPRGVEYELDGLLGYLKTKPEVTTILGIRDILDTPSAVKEEWRKKRNEQIINEFYDAVWIYGDRNFYDSCREYEFSEQLTWKLSFTGYLNPLCRHKVKLKSSHQKKKTKKNQLPDNFHLCMAGGGQDGIRLIQTFVEAIAGSHHNGVLLTGPFLPEKAFKQIKKQTKEHKNIKLIRFYHEPVNLIKRADKVVSMGGYNSVSELLALEKKALILPRVNPRQEQLIRANKLNEWGLIDVVHPENFSADFVRQWLNQDPPAHSSCKKLDFDGLDRIVHNIMSYLKASENNQEIINDVA